MSLVTGSTICTVTGNPVGNHWEIVEQNASDKVDTVQLQKWDESYTPILKKLPNLTRFEVMKISGTFDFKFLFHHCPKITEIIIGRENVLDDDFKIINMNVVPSEIKILIFPPFIARCDFKLSDAKFDNLKHFAGCTVDKDSVPLKVFNQSEWVLETLMIDCDEKTQYDTTDFTTGASLELLMMSGGKLNSLGFIQSNLKVLDLFCDLSGVKTLEPLRNLRDIVSLKLTMLTGLTDPEPMSVLDGMDKLDFQDFIVTGPTPEQLRSCRIYRMVERRSKLQREVAGQSSCANCNSSGVSALCTACKDTWYCNADCQRADWKKHKARCRKCMMELVIHGVKWMNLPEHYDSVDEELEAIEVFVWLNRFQDYQYMNPLVDDLKKTFGVDYTQELHDVVREIYENLYDTHRIAKIVKKSMINTKKQLQFIYYAITNCSPVRAKKFTASMARSCLDLGFDGLYGFQR